MAEKEEKTMPRLGIRLPQDLIDWLGEQANGEGLSVSAYIRRSLTVARRITNEINNANNVALGGSKCQEQNENTISQ